jgi:DNA-binding CsgD family transcriptional regulator
MRLSNMRKKQGRFDEALRFHEQFLTYKDSVFNQEKEKISRELTVKYETHEKELTIAALERENRLATQRNRWIGGMLTLLSVIGFYTLRIRSLRKQAQLALEKAQSEVRTKQLTRELEIKNMELAAHAARLTDFAHMLVERNRQLNDLTTQMQTGKSSVPSEDADNLFNLVILTEADWERFQEYFNRAYPGYITKLRTRYPDVTPAEIRLVLLDKMGLSQKEASAILGIGIDAVKKGRYRLKKKYNLVQDDLSAGMAVD